MSANVFEVLFGKLCVWSSSIYLFTMSVFGEYFLATTVRFFRLRSYLNYRYFMALFDFVSISEQFTHALDSYPLFTCILIATQFAVLRDDMLSQRIFSKNKEHANVQIQIVIW